MSRKIPNQSQWSREILDFITLKDQNSSSKTSFEQTMIIAGYENATAARGTWYAQLK